MYSSSLKRNVRRGFEVLREDGLVAFIGKAMRLTPGPYRAYLRFSIRAGKSRRVIDFLSDLYFTLDFVFSRAGNQYGMSPFKRYQLLSRIKANNRQIPTGSHWHQHVLLAEAILLLPRTLEGDVVECGVFNGASTASLSLVCAITGRRLLACDSFEGLPEPEESEKHAIVAGSRGYYYWQQGEYASAGGLEAVKDTVSKHGNIHVCKFIQGYFNDTLKDLETDAIVLVFEDADLPSSVRDCIIHLWPKLQEGCKFFCHEPWSTDVVGLFYNKSLWNRELGAEPPGFFGSGHGLSTGLRRTGMGYAMKSDQVAVLEQGWRRVNIGSKDHIEPGCTGEL